MYRIGIDVGGTFTDCVLTRPSKPLVFTKVATTPRDQSEGMLGGIAQLAANEGCSLRELLTNTEVIVHGTTTADNTMIEMDGAVTGLITTAGHRDEIELRRGYKESIWDPALPPPIPIAQRRRRIGVPERLDFEGNVVVPLDEEAVRKALQRLKKLGTESLAVVFMFSFINPSHERRVRELAAEDLPGVSLSLSHEVMPSAPEFERTSTTLVNAFVAPRIQRYLSRLVQRLQQDRFGGSLLIMQSNGGVMPPEYIQQRPVTILGSGPTGGVVAACAIAKRAETKAFVCADMGGTSYDVCLVRGGEPEIKSGWNWHYRYLIGLPTVAVQSIGAGGGSIASVRAGVLQVGPQSAGADPGPVCYGRGGRLPTVTDANLLLGYLNPDDFCAGTMRLDVDAAHAAIAEDVAEPLGLDPIDAAFGIFRLVNANMSNAIRRVSADRGVDPRGLTMLVYGGNGPVHATAQARELGIKRVLVPKTSPAFSALGLLFSNHAVDEIRAYITPAASADLKRINAYLEEMAERARRTLARRRRGPGDQTRAFAHLCYPGQTFDLAVPIAATSETRLPTLKAADWAATIERFHTIHEQLHTYAARDQSPILRGLRLSSAVTVEVPRLPSFRPRTSVTKAKMRAAYIGGRLRRVPVYVGSSIGAGRTIRGPAIIEEAFTTIVLGERERLTLDARGTYEIEVGPR